VYDGIYRVKNVLFEVDNRRVSVIVFVSFTCDICVTCLPNKFDNSCLYGIVHVLSHPIHPMHVKVKSYPIWPLRGILIQ